MNKRFHLQKRMAVAAAGLVLTLLAARAGAGTGNISGFVTATGGGPIVGAMVVVYGPSGFVESSGITDGTGFYITSPTLDTATHSARTTNDLGYLNEMYDDIPCYSGCSPAVGTPIAVVDGNTTPGIDFILDPGGSISGTVRDATDASPIAGAAVFIYTQSSALLTSATTEADGSWVAGDGLESGSYYVRTNNVDGYFESLYLDIPYTQWCDVTIGDLITVTAPAITSGIDIVLTPGLHRDGFENGNFCAWSSTAP